MAQEQAKVEGPRIDDRQRVIIGKKDWSAYAMTIQSRMGYGSVKVEARGRLAIEKGAGVLATCVRQDPTCMVEAVIMSAEFKKGDQTFIVPSMVASIVKK